MTSAGISRPVRFLPEARQDLIETRQWYDLRQAGFGAVFAGAFADAIERMQAQPLSYPAVVGSIRRVILQRFPYAIYFRVETDEILVLAVHGRQDPGRWRERIPQTTEP